jgi:hypothetical protein
MRPLYTAAVAFALCGFAGLAAAQDPSGSLDAGRSTPAPANPQAVGTEDRAPAGVQAPLPPAGDPAAAAQGPIGSTAQTLPSKFSDAVAAADAVPIMARKLPLTDEQRRQIYKSVMAQSGPAVATDAKPADGLPASVEIKELPQEIAQAIPAIRGLKYARTEDKVLLVSPPNKIVVGEIEK